MADVESVASFQTCKTTVSRYELLKSALKDKKKGTSVTYPWKPDDRAKVISKIEEEGSGENAKGFLFSPIRSSSPKKAPLSPSASSGFGGSSGCLPPESPTLSSATTSADPSASERRPRGLDFQGQFCWGSTTSPFFTGGAGHHHPISKPSLPRNRGRGKIGQVDNGDGLKRTEKNEAGEVKGPGMIDGNATEPPSMNEETNDIDSMMAELRAAMEDPKPILLNQESQDYETRRRQMVEDVNRFWDWL